MSADNYYLIRRHPFGGFAAVMGFASSEDTPTVDAREPQFASVSDAISYADRDYSEYGTSVHPECTDTERGAACADLDHVTALAARVWEPAVLPAWWSGNNTHLDGARPIDVYHASGIDPVLDAFHADLVHATLAETVAASSSTAPQLPPADGHTPPEVTTAAADAGTGAQVIPTETMVLPAGCPPEERMFAVFVRWQHTLGWTVTTFDPQERLSVKGRSWAYVPHRNRRHYYFPTREAAIEAALDAVDARPVNGRTWAQWEALEATD